ncbi:serine/threonine-protein kinase [Streptomyces sp. NPDC020379]|uniref:serine/threonine-protein kinase n=1 Tax=Streptomyces sp. NPDC020379 TaxID=3365071 RepID=UPI0037926308
MSTGDAKYGELIGKLLGGRYRVTATVGRGGMGVVARAVDTLLDREVAVKVLRAYTDASAAELAGLRARMRREARAAARVRHRGVVTVHDVTEEEGLPVIVMELVDGPSLDDVLAERGALDPREAAAIGAELTDALDAAHRAGVLHRDVKPGNVLLERGGRVVLTDFGIASIETSGDDAMAKLTRSGEIVGSLDYLPPERAQGAEPGPASDIWSLGMTLYAAVEGTSPFRRTSVWSTLSAIVGEPLPEPRRAGPLAPVLRALMAKEPERRPTAGQARAMLEQAAAGGPAAPVSVPRTPTEPSVVAPGFGPPPAVGTGGAPSPQPAPAPAPARGGKAPRRGRVLIAAAAAAVVLVGGGVAYALVGEHGDGRARAAAPGPAASPSGRPGPGGDADGTRVWPSPSGSQGKPSATASEPGAPPRAPAASSVKPSPLPTACGGWNHRDPDPGTYGYMTGSYHLETGPYANCPDVSVAKAGANLWYHCYVANAYGHKWTYVRIAGTSTAGWMSNDNLTRQNGPSTHC